MASPEGSCSFHTVDSPHLDDSWTCNRPALDNRDTCLFHTAPDERAVSDEHVAELVHMAITGVPNTEDETKYVDQALPDRLTASERKQFVGARFGDLNLPPSAVLSDERDYSSDTARTSIDFREAEFGGSRLAVSRSTTSKRTRTRNAGSVAGTATRTHITLGCTSTSCRLLSKRPTSTFRHSIHSGCTPLIC
jgi:hypothetical protein